jgi:hypothetical protein
MGGGVVGVEACEPPGPRPKDELLFAPVSMETFEVAQTASSMVLELLGGE